MSIDIDVGKISEDLNNKADLDMNNTVGHLGTSAKEFYSRLSLPSKRYVNLTLPASGNKVTAPADGWLELRKTGSDQQYIKITSLIEACASASGSSIISIFVPMQKGEEATLTYNATGTTHAFRFVYAEGVK